MNARQRRILQLLSVGGHNTTSLAFAIGAPEPSIRRAIQTLRANGWNISFADERTGVYTIAQPFVLAQGDGDQGDDFDNGLNAFDTDIDTDEGFL